MSQAIFPAPRVGRFGAGLAYRAPDASSIGGARDDWQVNVDRSWPAAEQPDRTTADEPGANVTHFRLDALDFIVNVYAAVVTAPHDVERASRSSVLKPDQILPYLAGLAAASR